MCLCVYVCVYVCVCIHVHPCASMCLGCTRIPRCTVHQGRRNAYEITVDSLPAWSRVNTGQFPNEQELVASLVHYAASGAVPEDGWTRPAGSTAAAGSTAGGSTRKLTGARGSATALTQGEATRLCAIL